MKRHLPLMLAVFPFCPCRRRRLCDMGSHNGRLGMVE